MAEGGEDTGPTPTEMFLSGLAACVTFYAGRFLRRHELPTEGLSVACNYSWAGNPHRVGAIELKVTAPDMSAAKLAAFQRVIGHCTVHNTLEHPPLVLIRVTRPETAAA